MSLTIKPKLVVFDPDLASLAEMERMLRPIFRINAAASPAQFSAALAASAETKAVILSSGKGLNVLAMLHMARQSRPDAARLLLTTFDDLSVIVEGLHSGVVQRVLSKPLQFAELLSALPRSETAALTADARR